MANFKRSARYQHNHQWEKDFVSSLMEWQWRVFKPLLFQKAGECKVSYALSEEPISFKEKDSLPWKPLSIGEKWADHVFQCAWFKVEGNAKGILDPVLAFDIQGEASLFDEDGSSVMGFTNGDNAWNIHNPTFEKKYCPIGRFVKEDGSFLLYLDGAANHLQGGFFDPTFLKEASVGRMDAKIAENYYDFDVLLCYLGYQLGSGKPFPYLKEFEEKLGAIKSAYDYQDPDAYAKAKEAARFLFSLPGDDDFGYTAIGHAHQDLLWLWPERETKRKILRTLSTTVYLLERYPDYTFTISQPQQLSWLEEEDPKLFARLKRYIDLGRVDYEGGGWVESDTNLPSEESLAHQELYGQKYWKERFGRYARICWLPDSFGYTASLPQILRLSGQDYFLTEKLSMSAHTVFPYVAFDWVGIDGTSVFAHLPPAGGGYNSLAGPAELLIGEEASRRAGQEGEALLVYGIGDGGSGPSVGHLERIAREGSLAYLPKVKNGRADDFFARLSQKPHPSYQGELYLERHQGTYTSQSRIKQNNRRFEEEAKALEFLYASRGEGMGALDQLWKEAMLYQFHDCLPGSSIQRVYEECDGRYQAMFDSLERLAEEEGLSFSAGEGSPLLNHLGQRVRKIVKRGDSYLVYDAAARETAKPRIASRKGDWDGLRYQNAYYSVSFDPKTGEIHSLSSASGRALLRGGNQLRVFLDHGDAWDMAPDYRDQPERFLRLESMEAKDYGEIKEIVLSFSYLHSKLEETIILDDHSPCLLIHHEVDWRDTGYMLRAEFKPARFPKKVRSDIQFGYGERSTGRENEHASAQEEMCCQQWLDLSGKGEGIALLNHAKNGFFAKDGLLSLNLLRSTDYPCLHSDQKPTSYDYALYPHDGGFDPIRVDELAFELNAAFLFGEGEIRAPWVDNPAVVVSCFKPAYDGEGEILRLYERTGKPQKAKINLPHGEEIDEEVNLLEDAIGPAPEAELSFHPFQIRTFRVRRKRS